jgi:hypothetical protein
MWLIRIRSRWTGEAIVLGGRYPTRDAAERFATDQVCDRCNYIDVVPDYHAVAS